MNPRWRQELSPCGIVERLSSRQRSESALFPSRDCSLTTWIRCSAVCLSPFRGSLRSLCMSFRSFPRPSPWKRRDKIRVVQGTDWLLDSSQRAIGGKSQASSSNLGLTILYPRKTHLPLFRPPLSCDPRVAGLVRMRRSSIMDECCILTRDDRARP